MACAPPKRGGDHPTYAMFLGGVQLDNNYWLTGARHCWFTAQQRGGKVINYIEQELLSTINSKDSEKLNDNLEKLSEMDKETFIKQLRKKVWLHGQQIFYAIMYQNQVLSLFWTLPFGCGVSLIFNFTR